MPKSRSRAVGIPTLLLALASPPPVRALEPVRLGEPVIRPLVEEALRANPEVVAIREAIAAARARVGPAGALPDPTATFTAQWGGKSLGNDDDTFVGVSVEQPLPAARK